MKKRSVIAFLCACGFSLSYFSFPILAATVSTVTSNATVTFTPGTELTGPVDPDDPSKPLDPPGQGTGESGPLSIDYVPNITFGSQAISGSQKVYNASELKPFVQVTDIRGTGAGWNVIAKATPFNDGAADSLKGSTVTFAGGYAISANSSASKPTPSNPVVLTTDNTEATVVVANENSGLGTWVDRWYPTETTATSNDNVTLTVPSGSATAKTHTSTITWTLADAPI